MAASTAAAASASETSSDEEWMNGCLFECKICPVRLESLASMRSHLSSFHATSLEAYESVHGSALVKITQIVCHVCLAAVPCDAEFVTSHLQLIHQMSPDEYRRLYDPPAGKIFSFSLCSCNCSLQPYGRLFLGACECDHRSLIGLVRLIESSKMPIASGTACKFFYWLLNPESLSYEPTKIPPRPKNYDNCL